MELSGSVTSPLSDDDVKHARTKSTSLMLSVESFDLNPESLRNNILKNRPVEFFLRLMGIIWSSNEYSFCINVLQYTWNFALRCGLLLFLGYCCYLLVTTFLVQNSLVNKIFAITIFLQCSTLYFALYDINRRLNSKVSNHYVLHLTRGLNASYIVLFITCIIAAIPSFLFAVVDFPKQFIMAYLWGELSMCCFLTATMYFISMDCAVASSLLDQLMEHQRMELLTAEQYTLAQKEIRLAQSFSQWINNCIVVVALLDIASVLLTLLTGEKNGFANFGVFSVIFYLAFLLKEIPFVCVVYWQVAEVNEKYTTFMKTLSVAQWDSESNSDNRRMAIYIRAQGQPIGISLAGMKLKRKDLAWQFALWLFAFAVSSVRAAVINSA